MSTASLPSPKPNTSATQNARLMQATLAYERALRDSALQRYELSLQRFKEARRTRLCLLLRTESHTHNLELLRGLLERAWAMMPPNEPCENRVSEPLVSIVEILATLTSYEKVEANIKQLLSLISTRQQLHCDARRSTVSAYSLPRGISLNSGTTIDDAQSSHVETSSGALAAHARIRPLLFWLATPLTYAEVLRRHRMPLLSRLARVLLQVQLTQQTKQEICAATSPVDEEKQREHEIQLAEERDAYTHAKEMQLIVKHRLYELHRWLNRNGPVHVSPDVYVDASVAHEIKVRIRQELSMGQTMLLRILCEKGRDAFDEHGALKAG